MITGMIPTATLRLICSIIHENTHMTMHFIGSQHHFIATQSYHPLTIGAVDTPRGINQRRSGVSWSSCIDRCKTTNQWLPTTNSNKILWTFTIALGHLRVIDITPAFANYMCTQTVANQSLRPKSVLVLRELYYFGQVFTNQVHVVIRAIEIVALRPHAPVNAANVHALCIC